MHSIVMNGWVLSDVLSNQRMNEKQPKQHVKFNVDWLGNLERSD